MARGRKAIQAEPVTAKAQLSAATKRARDIMRKDAGLNGDLDRIPQLSWVMFLKCFDDFEQRREVTEKKYRPAIEPPYRWRDWAGDPDKGTTGEALLKFVNDDLFPYLRGLTGAGAGDARDVLAAVFKETYNRMLSGYLLRDVVNLVNQLKVSEPRTGTFHEYDSDQLRVRFEDVHAELNRRLNSGLRRGIADLVREYANRGLRDRRIERALIGPQAPYGMTDFPSTLQRLGELLEIQLAKNDRPLRLERESRYRVWRSSRTQPFIPFGRSFQEVIERLILRARAEERKIPPKADNETLGSE